MAYSDDCQSLQENDNISEISVSCKDESFTVTDDDSRKSIFSLLKQVTKCDEDEGKYTDDCKLLSFTASNGQYTVQFSEDETHIRINGKSFTAGLYYCEFWNWTEKLSFITICDLSSNDFEERMIYSEDIVSRIAEIIDIISEGEPQDGEIDLRKDYRTISYSKCGDSYYFTLPLDDSCRLFTDDNRCIKADRELIDELTTLTAKVK